MQQLDGISVSSDWYRSESTEALTYSGERDQREIHHGEVGLAVKTIIYRWEVGPYDKD